MSHSLPLLEAEASHPATWIIPCAYLSQERVNYPLLFGFGNTISRRSPRQTGAFGRMLLRVLDTSASFQVHRESCMTDVRVPNHFSHGHGRTRGFAHVTCCLNIRPPVLGNLTSHRRYPIPLRADRIFEGRPQYLGLEDTCLTLWSDVLASSYGNGSHCRTTSGCVNLNTRGL
jgi:hypothetical protein